MRPTNMNPDELDSPDRNDAFDADRREDRAHPTRPLSEPEVAKEVDRDGDGLPDDPAAYRVPS